uniref:Fatty-acid amide hydrolase 1 n=1 Tax=Leptobrachium leishanense TaxID=445787 RepID=A0A8C5Q7Y5_9ANUR
MLAEIRGFPGGVRALCALLAGSAVSLLLLLRWMRIRRLLAVIKRVREKRDTALRRMEETAGRLANQFPVADPAVILSLSLAELSKKLQDGSVSPEMVLQCYMRKALEAAGEVNCVVDYLDECEEQLEELRRQKHKGPLYGVPVSIKENISCKGHACTLGLIKRLNLTASEDSVIVQVLKKQGAIPFVRTNVPQSMLNYDCSNPIYGQTLNPLNHKKTPGGSSGGEGALIASGGSILGVGSDIGGSIRLPSTFCGICGFKPTGNRFSKRGIVVSSPGQRSVTAMAGPLARDVDSLALVMKTLLCKDMFNLDPVVPPLPFNEEVYSSSRPLCIGYYDDDGFTQATPSMRRAVLETKALLERAGHKLVPFTPPEVERAIITLSLRGLMADGGATFLDNFKGDIVDPNLKAQVSLYFLPNWLNRLLSIIMKPVFPRVSEVMRNTESLRSVKDLWKHHTEVEEYRQEFIAKWKKQDLDAVLCPILGPALTIGYPGQLSTAVSYSILYNLVDFPAGVVPVTTVTKEDEENLKSYVGHYNDFWDRLMKKAVTDGVGLPVSVQCVALPWQEEQCLRLMKEVERVVKT